MRATELQSYRTPKARTTEPQNFGGRKTEDREPSEARGRYRAEALAHMPIPRINHVAQGFIPASECGITTNQGNRPWGHPITPKSSKI